MILLDTHIWRWWASAEPRFTQVHQNAISSAGAGGVGISAISCWEIAKAVESGTLTISMSVGEWVRLALAMPNVVLIPLTPEIAVESTQLPQPIHKDPGDQIIIATARVLRIPLVTADGKILKYPHVQTIT